MIERDEALAITEDKFPNGPEALAKNLNVPVVRSPLHGLEGWCARDKNVVIRVNSNSSSSKQRFTLAHELAHLVLGSESDVYCEPFQSDNAEEKEADALAAEFLIPWSKLVTMGGRDLPVVSETVDYIAKAAKVSPVVAACRIVNSCEQLGLLNAAVVFLEQAKEKWRYSHGLEFSSSDAVELAHLAAQSSKPVRIDSESSGDVVVGSVYDGWQYQLLLAQLLPAEVANQEAEAEKTARIQKELFTGDKSFEGRVAGFLGALKNKDKVQNLDEAVNHFNEHCLVRFADEESAKLSSDDGQLFIRYRLRKWFHK